MARQKTAPAAKAGASSSSSSSAPAPAPEGFTPERFERELKDLASKAQQETWSRQVLGQTDMYARSVVLLCLLGIASVVSQMALSPVYGAIPAAAWHSKLLMAGCFVGWAFNIALRRVLAADTAQWLPLVAVYVPAVHTLLGRFSSVLGAQWGPLTTEAVTLFPLAVLSAASVADHLEGAQLGALPSVVADAAPGLGSWGVFKLAQHVAEKHLQIHAGRVFLYTRVGLQMLLAASYAVFAPSKYLVMALPALLHTAVWNTHVLTPAATASLNETLLSEGWMLLDRRESVTGYLSVLENVEQGFRIMRCDHSLLGGEWVHYRDAKVAEPIYGVFVMLEAVRLVEREVEVADADARALVIGLGVGTTPSAFVTHGIDTTVVEIDPVVHDLALKYFDLRENRHPVLVDAVKYTAQLATDAPATFDYIVHDVFTGGAEPVDLFTVEFLEGLAALLKPDGVIAINYAGDFTLPAPRTIVRTINAVFPTCRIFRESPPDADLIASRGSDFTNMVIFCTKAAAGTKPLSFREPVAADFLDSVSRQAFLRPQHEVEQLDFLAVEESAAGSGILRRNDTSKVTEWHRTSAKGHWAIMRTVMPPEIWERW